VWIEAVKKGEKVASETVGKAAGKFKINAPVVVAAIVIGAAGVHGAWRGKRRHEERSFVEAEDERRANAGQRAYG
jgi:hypothetical protein